MMNQLQSIAPLVGRVLLSVIFILSGLSKIGGYAGTAGYMEMMGIPGFLLPIVILVEAGAGVMLLVGWNARLAAVLLGGFAALSGILFHLVPGMGLEDAMAQQAEMTSFMKNMAIAGGMAFVFAFGAGKWSLDSRA